MITRVTNLTTMRAAERNLQASASRLAKLQDQASTQRAINRPSDDPAGTTDSMRIRAAQAANAQYNRNIDDGNGWLATLDSTIGSATAILRRIRDLTVQGANDGAMSPAAKQAIAVELKGLKQELLVEADTRYAGRAVFAGNSDASHVFAPNATPPSTPYDFQGAGDGPVERRVADGTTVRVDSDGATVFGSGSTAVFQVIDNIVNDLTVTGNNVGHYLTDIDARMNAMVSERATVGVRQAQMQRAQEANLASSGALEAQRSGVEDVDLGQAILNLQLQQVAYQSTLAVTAKVLQPTLMDFLR